MNFIDIKMHGTAIKTIKKTIENDTKIVRKKLGTTNIRKRRMPYILGGWVRQIMGRNLLEVI